MKTLDLTDYTGQLFGMYGGMTRRVGLECENSLIGVMIDRFGKDIPVIKTDDEHFMTYIDAAVSPQFFGWVASLGGGARISAPESVAEEMRALTEKLYRQYN